jgi:glucose/arabinose dehydrogenase
MCRSVENFPPSEFPELAVETISSHDARMKLTFCFAGLLGVLSGAQAHEIRFEPVWAGANIHKPISVVQPPGETDRHFVVQQRGKIRIFPTDPKAEKGKTFLDFKERKMEENEFEEGLLGLAFHPKFKENRRCFVFYTQQNPKRSVVSEILVSADNPNLADLQTERVILEIPKPFWNHTSGNLLFGPDGLLYISVGDGGKRDDVSRLAQKTDALNGKILRIDVDQRSEKLAYGIPAENPFMKTPGYRPEIFALGLRNPWGLSIDPTTGLFWCADVGQERAEEINLIVKGGNYGWSFREGKETFVGRTDAPPSESKFIDPIHIYARDAGLSVTGGIVYRGKALPKLVGCYLYGDWGTGRIWALKWDSERKTVVENRVIFENETDQDPTKWMKPSAFCTDGQGEVLVLNWNGGVFALKPN